MLKAAELFLSACCFWLRDQFCKLPEVLSCGCELELFVCAFWSSKPHHRDADVSFQMGKQHLDFPPLDERGHVSISFSDIAGDVTRRFVDRTKHVSGWLFGTAICFQ